MKEIGLILAFLTITAMSFGQHLDYKVYAPNDYHRLGTEAVAPHINFEIFDIRDSSFCYQCSRHAITHSSCVPPNVGGDIFVIGKFIFLNRSACVSCGSYGTPNIDYCRPVINFIFGKLTGGDISTLADIARQLPIKSGR